MTEAAMARELTEEEQEIADRLYSLSEEERRASHTRQLTAEEIGVFDKALKSSIAPVAPVTPGPVEPLHMPYPGPSPEEPRDAAPPRRGGLSAQVEDLDPVAERLDKLVARARSVVDKINGTRPRPGENRADVVKEPTPSIISTLRMKRDRMARSIDLLERELGALEECL
jgi:hypothetical protein